MQTDVAEIAPGIYRLSTLVAEIGPPMGFTFNQFLIDADQPLLFHCGPRAMFPLVSAALEKVMPVAKLRWIGFGHVESDECGAMNQWLAAAPERRWCMARPPAWSRSTIWPTGRRAPWRMARPWIWAKSACAISIRRMCPMPGNPA